MVPARHRRQKKIFAFIEQDALGAAIFVDEHIQEKIQSLSRFPEYSRQGQLGTTRELIISKTPYIVVYLVLEGIVRILRVLHGAQLWPDDIPDK